MRQIAMKSHFIIIILVVVKPNQSEDIESDSLEYDALPSEEEVFSQESERRMSTRCRSSCTYKSQDFEEPCTKDQSCRRSFVCSIGNLCTTKGLSSTSIGGQCVHSSDCSQGLRCLTGVCETMGRSGDPCGSSSDCRGSFFCHAKRQVCSPKLKRGTKCHSNSECLNSLCLRPQGHETLRLRHCAIVGVAQGKECNPTSLHCRRDMDCVPVRSTSVPSQSELRNPEKRPGLGRSKIRRQRRRRRPRFKRQTQNERGLKYICQRITIRADSEIPCSRLLHCPCGEYCHDRTSKCRAARCTETGGECLAYNLPFNFRCHHGVCMFPPEDIQASIDKINRVAKGVSRPKGKAKLAQANV